MMPKKKKKKKKKAPALYSLHFHSSTVVRIPLNSFYLCVGESAWFHYLIKSTYTHAQMLLQQK